MTRSMITRVFGVSAMAFLLLARPASSAAQVESPPRAPLPTPPRRDSLRVEPLRVTTPPPSGVRPTGIRSTIRAAEPVGPVAMVAPSPPVSPARQAAPTVVAGPPAPTPLAPPVRTPIAASAVTPAQRIASAAAAPPAGATMRCKDGTFLTGAPSEQRCDGNGGVSVTFPAAAPTPQPPVRRP
ncbi:hypothetical protein BH11GEM1_BH11GEM1_20500 [soil metagenome]